MDFPYSLYLLEEKVIEDFAVSVLLTFSPAFSSYPTFPNLDNLCHKASVLNLSTQHQHSIVLSHMVYLTMT